MTNLGETNEIKELHRRDKKDKINSEENRMICTPNDLKILLLSISILIKEN